MASSLGGLGVLALFLLILCRFYILSGNPTYLPTTGGLIVILGFMLGVPFGLVMVRVLN